MFNNLYTQVITAALMCSILLCCKKSFLDSPPQDNVAREAYVTDLKTLNETLDGLYLRLGAAYATYTALYPELVADNMRPPKGTSHMDFIYNWEQKAGNNTGYTLSSTAGNFNCHSFINYQVISIANFVIEKAAQYRTENPVVADDMKGQALAIRALCHFSLVNTFAQSYNYSVGATHPGVVYQIHSQLNIGNSGRNTVAEVYSKLIDDLNQARQLMQPITNSTLKVSKNTVMALLSRVLLYKEDYRGCINNARQVIAKTPLMEVSKGYPFDLYKLTDPAKTEVLLNLLPTGNPAMGFNGGNFMGGLFRNTVRFAATKDLGDLLALNPADARSAWVKRTGTEWYITKFPVAAIAGLTPPESAYYHNVIGVSELCLNVAEAYANLNQIDSARYFLDMIRKRAFPGATPSTDSGSQLLESIRIERRKELCFDGLRLYDLQRWKKNIERIDPNLPSAQTLVYPSNKSIAPIPLQDVIIFGLEQNPDY